jgi:hypothetical protein
LQDSLAQFGIQGAPDLIGKTEVFLLEAGVTCPFENSVARAVTTMEALGYRLIDITELNRSPGSLSWLSFGARARSSPVSLPMNGFLRLHT